MTLALTGDFGGTRIKLGLVDDQRILAQRVVDAESRKGLEPLLRIIEQHFRELAREADVAVDECSGIGLAFPCLIDPKTQSICSTIDKYPDATRVDLKSWARDQLGLRLLLENDANAALAGEWQRGAGRGFRSIVLMTLGTGVGTSAIIDGVPLRGQHGQAGCLGGHMTIAVDGPECVCGNIGCTETQASTWALPDIARSDADFNKSRLGSEAVIDYAAVFRLADEGDQLSTRLRDRTLRVWSATAVNLVHAYDPEIIILGGGIMRTPEPTRSFVEKYVNEYAWLGWGKVSVSVAELPDTAALVGMHYLISRTISPTTSS
jgi:glucokinase